VALQSKTELAESTARGASSALSMISYWIDEDLVLHIMETMEMQYALAQTTWLIRMFQTSMEIVGQMVDVSLQYTALPQTTQILTGIELPNGDAHLVMHSSSADERLSKWYLVLASQGPSGSSPVT
jgi:hypothetical protein